jgi:uncharacterized protein
MMMNLTNNEGVQTPSLFPERSGVSLKPNYFQQTLSEKPKVGFFEIHAENYLAPGGPNKYYLEKIREHYPVTVHGVGLSIGGESPLNLQHLHQVASLVERIEPIVFSEHLAWSSHSNHFYNDLLPLPYTEETLQRVCQHIEQVQETLKRRILIENPSTYLSFNTSTFAEYEFITEIVRRSGCGLLLDVNNVAVSCFNQQKNPLDYLNAFPLEAVEQIHLAGFSLDTASSTPLRIDSHDREVSEEVWQLFTTTLERMGDCATLIEWDGQLPTFEQLQQQAHLADTIRQRARIQNVVTQQREVGEPNE